VEVICHISDMCKVKVSLITLYIVVLSLKYVFLLVNTLLQIMIRKLKIKLKMK
jgi:hypothetical protein